MKRILVPLALPFFASCMSLQEASDQASLRRIFSLPDDVQIVRYEGFPEHVGFGQREGLRLSARYQLTPEQMRLWVERAPANGWKALPMPTAVRERMAAFKFEELDDMQQGFYLCRTAGDNVLQETTTKQCTAVENQNDIIAGVVNTATGEMSGQVESFY